MNPDELRRRLRFAEARAQHAPTWNVEEGGGVGSLHIYGVIGGYWGGVDAAELVPALRALDVATLNVYINSPGGDVYEGIAIRNALRQHSANVVVTVDGLAASAASFIACAGDELVMGENAEIMIHDAWTIALGNADDMRLVAGDLDRISDNIAAMYAAKAGGEPTAWRELMKAETWYSAEEAVAAGLADRLDSEQPAAAARFDLSMFAHAGRAEAPAPSFPLAPAALAPTRKDTLMNRAQLAAALAAGQITQAEHDSSIAMLDRIDAGESAPAALAPVAAAPGVPVAAEYAAGPASAPAPVAHTTDRPRSFAQVAADAVLAAQDADSRSFVRIINDALETVVPADDAGGGFTAPDRIGEVWQARPEGRPVIDSLGGTKPLTAMKIEGWKWALPTPAPAPYAGGLVEIPTDDWATVPVSETPARWAHGNKIDRIHRDLGSADLIASLFRILGIGYDAVSDAAVRTDLVAGATALTGGATSVLGAITKAHLQLKKIGATLTKAWMAEDLFTAFAELKVSDLPAWLANATGFVKLDGNVSLTNVFDVDVDFGLAAGGFLAYDKRSTTVYESPQIKLEALDIANGGIDIGFFAYGGTLIQDPRAVLKTTVVAE